MNDNFGQWHSERSRIYDLVDSSRSRNVAHRTFSRKSDFLLIEPQASGFYATDFLVLLPRLGVDQLIPIGVAADICDLFTAADAHKREYGRCVPADAVARYRDEHRDRAPGIMQKSMGADTGHMTDPSLSKLVDRPR
jgi:nicotinamidase-related amidase